MRSLVDEHRHLRRRADFGVIAGRCPRSSRRIRVRSATPLAHCVNSSLVHSKRWSAVTQRPGGETFEAHVVLGVGRSDDDDRRGVRVRRRRARSLPAATGRGARSPRRRPRRRNLRADGRDRSASPCRSSTRARAGEASSCRDAVVVRPPRATRYETSTPTTFSAWVSASECS